MKIEDADLSAELSREQYPLCNQGGLNDVQIEAACETIAEDDARTLGATDGVWPSSM